MFFFMDSMADLLRSFICILWIQSNSFKKRIERNPVAAKASNIIKFSGSRLTN